MRVETSAKLLLWSLVAILIYATFARLSGATPLSGAPIPARNGGYWPPAARNDCLLTYYRNKHFACDRIAKRGFD